uniref:Uncharacterized protein n=1 Tax=Lepeophtheirus salmonis TaxID=72036 RepID=A0A0K2UPF4_LEPSM
MIRLSLPRFLSEIRSISILIS